MLEPPNPLCRATRCATATMPNVHLTQVASEHSRDTGLLGTNQTAAAAETSRIARRLGRAREQLSLDAAEIARPRTAVVVESVLKSSFTGSKAACRHNHG